MATIAAGSIDVDKAAKYPIVLSDALMGRGTRELYTGIRYNHKPSPTSSSELTAPQLKPSSSSDSTNFDLSFQDGSDEYQYQGVRNSGDGQYVLVFDPVNKHFVLHQVDSSFDMNLTSTPWDQDPSSLQSSYTQLQSSTRPRRKSSTYQRSQPVKADPVASSSNDLKTRKAEKPKKSKPPPREPTPEAEDEDSDDGLTIEYPGGPPPQRFQTLPNVYQSQPQAYEESEESDADAEYDDDGDDEHNKDVEMLELPSPIGKVDSPDADDIEDDLDLDLEAELERELAKEMGHGDESSESEEE